MQPGEWARAQAACERLLACIPGLNAPGYQPGLRRVVECLHADAARAAREGGDLSRRSCTSSPASGTCGTVTRRSRTGPGAHRPGARLHRRGRDLHRRADAGRRGLLLTTEYPQREDEEEGAGAAAGNCCAGPTPPSGPGRDAGRAGRRCARRGGRAATGGLAVGMDGVMETRRTHTQDRGPDVQSARLRRDVHAGDRGRNRPVQVAVCAHFPDKRRSCSPWPAARPGSTGPCSSIDRPAAERAGAR